MSNLTTFDRKVLCDLAGEPKRLSWGAAVSEALEYLHRLGLVDREQRGDDVLYVVNARGKDAIGGGPG